MSVGASLPSPARSRLSALGAQQRLTLVAARIFLFRGRLLISSWLLCLLYSSSGQVLARHRYQDPTGQLLTWERPLAWSWTGSTIARVWARPIELARRAVLCRTISPTPYGASRRPRRSQSDEAVRAQAVQPEGALDRPERRASIRLVGWRRSAPAAAAFSNAVFGTAVGRRQTGYHCAAAFAW